MDEFLIGADLKRYLEPWAYARLNVVERALLAQRLPDEAAAAARHLRELVEMVLPTRSVTSGCSRRRCVGSRWRSPRFRDYPATLDTLADFDTDKDGTVPSRKAGNGGTGACDPRRHCGRNGRCRFAMRQKLAAW
jgi:hypothetical protein